MLDVIRACDSTTALSKLVNCIALTPGNQKTQAVSLLHAFPCAAASFAYSSGNRLYADDRPFYHMGLNAYWCAFELASSLGTSAC
jgi:hypothetical protein